MSVHSILSDKAIELYQDTVTGELNASLSSDFNLAFVLGRYTDWVKHWAHSQGEVVRVSRSKPLYEPRVDFREGYKTLPKVLAWLAFACEDDGFVGYVELSPYLKALREALVDFAYPLDEFNVGALRGEQAVGFVKALNGVFEGFRARVRSVEFKGLLASQQRLMRKNAQAMWGLLDGVFARHGRVLVIRLDTGFKEDMKALVTGHGVHRYREQLMAHVQQAFPALLGYAWKIEFMPKKGFHIHWLWLFNANEVCADSLIAQRIGEYWAKEITQGGGTYYNCNANQQAYERSALGKIRREDVQKRRHLSLVVDYLTKGDDYIRAKLPSGRRAFGKSRLVKR